MLQFFLGCKMRYWTKPQSQMYMNMCKCSTEIINDVIAVLRRHFCFFVFFLCSSVTSLLFFEFCVVLLLFHVELFSARAFESVRRSSLQYRITSLLQFNMAKPVFVILNKSLNSFYPRHGYIRTDFPSLSDQARIYPYRDSTHTANVLIRVKSTHCQVC